MPAIVAGIHVFCYLKKNVDGRNKSGHDEALISSCTTAEKRYLTSFFPVTASRFL
jgi:hypothetical protein